MASIQQGWEHLGWQNSFSVVVTDSQAIDIISMLGSDGYRKDPYTGKPVPFKAWVIKARALPKNPGYQHLDIGLPDRSGQEVFEALLDKGMIQGFSPTEEHMRALELQEMRYDMLVDKLMNTKIYLDASSDNSEFVDLMLRLKNGIGIEEA